MYTYMSARDARSEEGASERINTADAFGDRSNAACTWFSTSRFSSFGDQRSPHLVQ